MVEPPDGYSYELSAPEFCSFASLLKKFSRFLKLIITIERLSKDFSIADCVRI